MAFSYTNLQPENWSLKQDIKGTQSVEKQNPMFMPILVILYRGSVPFANLGHMCHISMQSHVFGDALEA